MCKTRTHLDVVVAAAAGRAANGEGGEVDPKYASALTLDCPSAVGVVRIVVWMAGTANDATLKKPVVSTAH